MKNTDQKELPKNVFVEPKGVFTNGVLCEAITDSGGTPVVEKIKYGNRTVSTLEMATNLLEKAYTSVANLNNELKFNVYAKINDTFQRFEILEPSLRRKAKKAKLLKKSKLEDKIGKRRERSEVQKAPD